MSEDFVVRISTMASQLGLEPFRQSAIKQKLKPYGSVNQPERGLSFQDTELSDEQIVSIFGQDAPSVEFGNRILRVLHGRRTDGTLDLPLPEDIEADLQENPSVVEDGLSFLRHAYPLDEDEAILRRIAREEDPREKEHPSVLMQRGQDLGLYKAVPASQEPYYGPQSGFYQSELSEKEGDPYGKSELDRIRAENDAKREKEEAELQVQIDAEMAKAQQLHDDRSRAIAQRPEQGLETAKELRPPNSFERWVLKARNRAQTKLTLESPEIANMSAFRRLFPSLLLAASLSVGCYFYAQTWTRPKQSDRLFPDVSLSSATIGALVAINVAIWVLWKVPSYWAVLNKYFLFVPAYPYAFSNLGNLFSHQSFYHLSMNMLALGIFGLPLHEEIGRGNFLAIYLASGLIGGFASFARHVVQRNMLTTVLGASGCVYGVISAYLALHMDDRFTLFFMPDKYMDSLSISGSTILFLFGASQAFGIVAPLGKYDYVDHFVGMIVGFFSVRWWQDNGRKTEKPDKKLRLGSWWDPLLGKGK
ncbi:hypothetical protein H2200_003091 [Cladophialophora chaetospira]|uniref:Peptidase S54 rhomboid domain-containing protein n=1 Tax=Cladophialophora chaetospira TaxID=386627 RepID=A0AA38XGP5_9EURO|nr:hypothetical protein H2200_003091 [Cladophialophora chaetospira]